MIQFGDKHMAKLEDGNYYAIVDDGGNAIGLLREILLPGEAQSDWDVLLRTGQWRPTSNPQISFQDADIRSISISEATSIRDSLTNGGNATLKEESIPSALHTFRKGL